MAKRLSYNHFPQIFFFRMLWSTNLWNCNIVNGCKLMKTLSRKVLKLGKMQGLKFESLYYKMLFLWCNRWSQWWTRRLGILDLSNYSELDSQMKGLCIHNAKSNLQPLLNLRKCLKTNEMNKLWKLKHLTHQISNYVLYKISIHQIWIHLNTPLEYTIYIHLHNNPSVNYIWNCIFQSNFPSI